VEGRGSNETTDGRAEPDRDDFEVLRESPMLGDGKYKLEIGAWHVRFLPPVNISFSADTVWYRTFNDTSPHAFPICDVPYVGLPQC
jgi:hypothetical protein